MKKNQNTKSEEKKVYVMDCTICGKKFRTCNRNRKVCDMCSRVELSQQCALIARKNKKKFSIDQHKNKDGVSFTTKCICCGQSFVSCNPNRMKCTSCTCDDIGIPPVEVKKMFSLGQEPDNTMPDRFKVKCYHCSLKNKCTRRKGRLRIITMCCSGEWVRCSQCIYALKCDKRNTPIAKDCRHGILANQAHYEDLDIPENLLV